MKAKANLSQKRISELRDAFGLRKGTEAETSAVTADELFKIFTEMRRIERVRFLRKLHADSSVGLEHFFIFTSGELKLFDKEHAESHSIRSPKGGLKKNAERNAIIKGLHAKGLGHTQICEAMKNRPDCEGLTPDAVRKVIHPTPPKRKPKSR